MGKVILTTDDELAAIVCHAVKIALQEYQEQSVPGESKDLPEFMSRHQVKDFLNVSIATVDNWTRQGVLKKHFVGGVPRFKRDEVRKVFASL